MSGWAPGAVTDMAVPDICSVADPASQRMFMFMVQEHRNMMVAMRECIGATNAATAGLLNVATALEATRAEIAAAVPLLSQAVRGNGVFPGTINASSPFSTSTGNTGDSTFSIGSMQSVDVPDGPLHCPFCQHRHDSEKVHVQHLVRLIDRFVSFQCHIVSLIDR